MVAREARPDADEDSASQHYLTTGGGSSPHSYDPPIASCPASETDSTDGGTLASEEHVVDPATDTSQRSIILPADHTCDTNGSSSMGGTDKGGLGMADSELPRAHSTPLVSRGSPPACSPCDPQPQTHAAHPPSGVAVICGDFNARPGYGLYKYMRSGTVDLRENNHVSIGGTGHNNQEWDTCEVLGKKPLGRWADAELWRCLGPWRYAMLKLRDVEGFRQLVGVGKWDARGDTAGGSRLGMEEGGARGLSG